MDSTLFSLTGAGFVLVTVIFYLWFYRVLKSGISKTTWTDERKRAIANRFLFVTILWATIVLAVASTDFFSDFSSFPPRFMIAIITPMVLILFAVFSKPVTELLPHIPSKDLVNIQVFRVPVELLLWASFAIGAAPEQVTFEGRNLDVLSGLLGPVVGFFLIRNRLAVYLYNFISLALLINIVAVAFLSLPTPFRMFLDEPSSIMVSQFPIIILPAMLVPLAYGLHFLSLRQLALRRE